MPHISLLYLCLTRNLRRAIYRISLFYVYVCPVNYVRAFQSYNSIRIIPVLTLLLNNLQIFLTVSWYCEKVL